MPIAITLESEKQSDSIDPRRDGAANGNMARAREIDDERHGPERFFNDVDRSAIERNKFGEEEPHTDEPELWNIDGTEMDF